MSTQTGSPSPGSISATLEALEGRSAQLATLTATERARLAGECIGSVAEAADEWALRAAAAKGLAADSPWLGEEYVVGPVGVERYLHTVGHSLRGVAEAGVPTLPQGMRRDGRGRLRAGVLPHPELFEGVVFKGFTGEVVLDETASESMPFDIPEGRPSVALVLGAGNQSSIAPVDALEQVFVHRRATLVKLHPNFQTLRGIYESALSPLTSAGYLSFVDGDAEEAAAALDHEAVDLVHITGARSTLEKMVAGRSEVGERSIGGTEYVAELGNVTPWIVVPGRWTRRELRAQAENLAGALLSNGSYNCICPKVVVTSRRWEQRTEFLEMVRRLIDAVPPRHAFYPSAVEAHAKLVADSPSAPGGCLPWILLDDEDPDARPELFERENFLPVSAEAALDELEPAAFLKAATAFVNSRLDGTLAATVVIQPKQRKEASVENALQEAVHELDYGTVCINQFAGVAWFMMALPWGASPGGSLLNPGSGFGFGHNPYMLRGVVKSIFEGPFRISPKPMWFASNKNPDGIGRAFAGLYAKPSVWRLGPLLASSLRG